MKHIHASSPRFSTKAFTLLEMMVVLLIIALILGAVAVMVQGIEGNAQDVTTQSKIKGIESALTSYKLGAMMYPTQAQGLDALVTRPTAEPKPKRWKQLAKPEGLLDPWGHKLVYRNPGKHNPAGYDVFSLGADGVENTEDDIGNW
ncbi:type II secretion system major pseudopilin GspG [Prosthecobacter vanneervenii]|uniref:Type II secretion system core protein G n=1 Tax=Prosthecobacter vanneervenii TaxID=48466 RepID=A0A7W7Y7C1_9BACT|nr:type II secretion system major pseudopilin GspG [Prosthecobacter vanneervenii]MBB5030944.1 general secretion pathway protein G [Prosthecobacter vanneervenii]